MKIENYREANPNEKFVAKFDIYLGEQWQCTWHEWKVIRNKKGGLFIAAPSFSKDDGFGGKKYFPYITFSQEKKASFEQKVMELLKEFVR